MNTLMNPSLHTCGCCKKELPETAFYVNKKTQHLDNYCKECRKTTSRGQYDSGRRIKMAKENRSYPVITRIADPETRKALIMNALQVVAESIAQKRRRIKNAMDNELTL